MAEQESLYGSKPSPMKNQSAKKGPKLSCGGAPSNRRLSLGGTMQQTCKTELPYSTKATPNTRQAKKSERFHQLDQFNHPTDDGFGALSTGNLLLTSLDIIVRTHSSGNSARGKSLDIHLLSRWIRCL